MSSKRPIPATHQHKPIPKGSLSHCSKSHSLLHLQEVKTIMETHVFESKNPEISELKCHTHCEALPRFC